MYVILSKVESRMTLLSCLQLGSGMHNFTSKNGQKNNLSTWLDMQAYLSTWEAGAH